MTRADPQGADAAVEVRLDSAKRLGRLKAEQPLSCLGDTFMAGVCITQQRWPKGTAESPTLGTDVLTV